MDNKLSELKDVADYLRKVKSGELPAPGPNEISITACTLDGAVSRIAALLAELEQKGAKVDELSRLLAHNIERAEAGEKRIAELESDLGLKHIRSVEEALIFATDRNSELEAKLATPVRLPEREFDDGSDKQACILAGRFNSGIDKSAEAIRAAGFKCVGDE